MLSRRSRSITGSQKVVPKIKPSKARKVIRRFHFLINKRALLNRLLAIGEKFRDNDEEFNGRLIDGYLSSRGLRGAYRQGYGMEGASEKKAVEEQLLRLNSAEHGPVAGEQLMVCLGYIQREITEGGLQNYQLASTVGQDKSRGGDSSKLLVKWLGELGYEQKKPLRALEIGSLSETNYISTSKIFDHVERIDLNSNARGIIRQDFMKRPLPQGDADRFNLISCSLVLNFVNTPQERGQMCQLFSKFLLHSSDVPSYVFIVLPLPCVSNSRYTTTDHFNKLMNFLGYTTVRDHSSHKLFYCLLEFTGKPTDKAKGQPTGQPGKKFAKKKEINPGPGRNNFAILL
ncbi:25S rRNA (adenine(2142)-N(1))-methyltransferase [Nakaseomyces bracarensis]|uniref:25S rRNA adenine-N(1) methyltransferase n=1 Tax=Nakaseomyces bracarensis TaxID=273131 RepID=A0ABR4NN33_9SACH